MIHLYQTRLSRTLHCTCMYRLTNMHCLHVSTELSEHQPLHFSSNYPQNCGKLSMFQCMSWYIIAHHSQSTSSGHYGSLVYRKGICGVRGSITLVMTDNKAIHQWVLEIHGQKNKNKKMGWVLTQRCHLYVHIHCITYYM